MGLFYNRGTRRDPLYTFDVGAAFDQMNAFHEQRQRDHTRDVSAGERQRQRSTMTIRARALELGKTAERAASILMLAYPHASRADIDYQSGKPPFQPNAGMPLREEIALVLHLSIQEAVLVISTGKGHIGYALRREIETLLLGAHRDLLV
jgi:hypothetical protein